MKKIIIVTIFLGLAMTASISGQINLNFSVGVNHSNCYFDNLEEITSKSRNGYFIGIAPNYQVNEKIQLLVGFQYSQKGYITNVTYNNTSLNFRLSYLDIIPEIEYNIFPFSTLGIGINYGLKLSEQYKIYNSNWSTNDIEIVNATDFGLTGKLKLRHNNIFGFVRYNIGLTDISDVIFRDINGEEIYNAKQLNRNLQIGIGYTLNSKKNKKK